MNTTNISSNDINLLACYDINGGCHTHLHSTMEMIYYIDGTHFATINGTTRQMSANDITFVNKYDVHKFISPDEGHLIMLKINSFFSSQFYDAFGDKNFCSFMTDKAKNQEILKDLKNLLNFDMTTLASPAKHERGPNKQILKVEINPEKILLHASTVNHILHLIISTYGFSNNKNNNGSIKKILMYINENYTKDITRKSVAEFFSYHENYFSTLFKKHIGLNFTDYVNLLRYNHVQSQSINEPGKTKTFIILSSGFNNTLSYYLFAKKYNKINQIIKSDINV